MDNGASSGPTEIEPIDMVRVVLLEDDPACYEFVHSLVAGSYGIDFYLDWVTSSADLFDHLEHETTDAVVMDCHVGKECGVNIARNMADRGFQHIPVILFTDVTDRDIDLAAMDAGVTDYLIKQETTASMFERSLRYAIRQKRTEAMVSYQALHDGLTGLANRSLLQEHLKRSMAEADRSGQFHALLFIDLDNFKTVNDTLGHSIGDDLLVEVAQRISGIGRKEDVVARFGGDEFVFLMGNLGANESEAKHAVNRVASKIKHVTCTPFDIEEHNVTVACSIGITLFNSDGAAFSELLKQSDIAMYKAKNDGKNQACFFVDEMEKTLVRDMAMVADLRQALERNELECFLQPIVCADDTSPVAAEVLLRWHHPQLGDVMPTQFIRCAEQYNLIVGIEQWVIRQACLFLNRLPELEFISVNISARHFLRPDFTDVVYGIVCASQTDPRRLVFELTETQLIEDSAGARFKMMELAQRGIRFALDDFGTGYSSVYLLKNLPFDIVKIDKSFIDDVHLSKASETFVAAIIAMGRALGQTIIAEGVETEAQHAILNRRHCTLLQGFRYAYPMSFDECVGWLNDRADDTLVHPDISTAVRLNR
ncbi:putative signaling protein [BD1-7 clade bacterium]|uniref:Putative signaling protein n=1 Tax=BD1-7 clade bacterium TaxID=2029982 RepID=A0A5S9MR38_9GAMM|nr:putative signaling protein [BD1-7 clade bacterium]CAA0085554.1 putative signaling protein [BD1-7 clade bacterium]